MVVIFAFLSFGTTSQVLITLIFFAFPQRGIMIGFLRFLYSEQSGIRSKTQSFGEIVH